MYKEDLALNNQQWLIRHKTKPNQTKQNHVCLIYMYKEDLALISYNGWYVIKPNQTLITKDFRKYSYGCNQNVRKRIKFRR